METNLAIARSLIGSPQAVIGSLQAVVEAPQVIVEAPQVVVESPQVVVEEEAPSTPKPATKKSKGKGKKKVVEPAPAPEPTPMSDVEEDDTDLIRDLNLAKARSLLPALNFSPPAPAGSAGASSCPQHLGEHEQTQPGMRAWRTDTTSKSLPTPQPPRELVRLLWTRHLLANDASIPRTASPPRGKATLPPREGFPPIYADTANFYKTIPAEQLARWDRVPEPKTFAVVKPANGLRPKTQYALRQEIAGLINVDPNSVNVAPTSSHARRP
ncbi:hypothetical protein C8F01DRAFT_1250504 [Mycena amicta]|nr:hypothetical protein C8F01DRAFT_1250504 [Mycena amicta]